MLFCILRFLLSKKRCCFRPRAGHFGFGAHLKRRNPPGPPPGLPAPLSDSEDEEYDPGKGKKRFNHHVLSLLFTLSAILIYL